jgi:DNA (cytosine-5)-methyltransferase 1
MAAHNVDAAITWLHTHMHDDRSVLALEPLRWALQLRPTWTVWEQVPAVLPLWEACAAVLRREGWSVVTGNVQAEQYGVPQTRRRAVLLARRDGVPATLPTPTHSRYHTRTPGRLDPGVRPWISMAKALGWGTAELVGFPRRWDGRGEELQLDGQAYRARDMRHTEMPARTLTEKTRSWTRWEADGQLALAWGFAGAGPTAERTAGQRPRELDTPAHTITGAGTAYWLVNHRERVRAEVAPRVNNQSGTEFDLAWPADRPAPVVAGREIVTMPGANANRYNGASKSRNDGVRVSVAEAAVLQTFPVDYPWQGTKTAQFRQVGDAVPPYLAYHLVREVTS